MSHGMEVNARKTKFMVVYDTGADREQMVVDRMTVEHCTWVARSPVTDGSTSTAIRAHARRVTCQALKFIESVDKNNDIPFYIKIVKFFHCALMSSIMYGCESRMDGDVKPVKKLYMWCIKKLLDVRKTTTNDLCLLESGFPPFCALVKAKQRKFFSKLWLERKDMSDDPLSLVIRMSLGYNCNLSRYVKDLMENNVDDVQVAVNKLKEKVRASTSSRYVLHCSLNPKLCVHEIYKLKRYYINEIQRISWTKLRLSAHSLAIEQGRWNRRGRGRLPVEERLCSCGQIQSEQHVLEQCQRLLGL